MSFEIKDSYGIDDLVEIIKVLRSPNGCPWDKEQTHKSIRKNFIEETYEAVEAIDNEDTVLLEEELGDVLLQIVLHSEIADESGNFNFDDVCDGICKKLIFRHPHVFGDKKATDPEHATDLWDKVKKLEKNQTTATESLNQVAKALPALMYAEKVQGRAAKANFDYKDTKQTLSHLKEEIRELETAIDNSDSENIAEELGDVLFSAVNLSRFLKLDPEKTLNDSTAKFIGRFTVLERLATKRGMVLEEASLDQLNSLWEEAKYIY